MVSSNHVVLDASALISLLRQEKGSDIVETVLSKAIMSSVNVAEVARFLIERQGIPSEKVVSTLESLIETIIPFDSKAAFLSAKLTDHTKQLGLSLGDRACLALALSKGYAVYTADTVWAQLKLECEIILIR